MLSADRSTDLESRLLPEGKPENTSVHVLIDKDQTYPLVGEEKDRYIQTKAFAERWLFRYMATLKNPTRRTKFNPRIDTVLKINEDRLDARYIGNGGHMRLSNDASPTLGVDPLFIPDVQKDLQRQLDEVSLIKNPKADSATLHAMELLMSNFPDDVSSLVQKGIERPYGILELSPTENRAMQMIRSLAAQIRTVVESDAKQYSDFPTFRPPRVI